MASISRRVAYPDIGLAHMFLELYQQTNPGSAAGAEEYGHDPSIKIITANHRDEDVLKALESKTSHRKTDPPL
jgi:hypothetical protein